MSEIITQKELKSLLHYNPETGVFTWIKRVSRRVNIGDIAGTIDNGYLRIMIKGKSYRLHRLAFLYMEGEHPIHQVDHKDRLRNNNKWSNLRHATQVQNQHNTSRNNCFVGVSRYRGDKWQVDAKKNKEYYFLGHFNTHFAACYARHAYNVSVGL